VKLCLDVTLTRDPQQPPRIVFNLPLLQVQQAYSCAQLREIARSFQILAHDAERQPQGALRLVRDLTADTQVNP